MQKLKCKIKNAVRRIHYIQRTLLIIVALSALSGCFIFRSEQVYENWNHLPESIQNIYYNIYQPPMFTHLDTLIAFGDTLQGYPKFKEAVDILKIYRKYAANLSLAFDGDTIALADLERSMYSSNQREVLILFSNIYDIDTARAIRGIKKILQTETDRTKKKSYQQVLKDNRNHNAWKIARQRERDSLETQRGRNYKQVSDTEIYSVLNKGLPNIYLTPYDWAFEVLKTAMMRGTEQDYQLARNIVVHALDSIYGTPSSSSRHSITTYVNRLLSIPAPGDTVNEKTRVMEIFEALSTGHIYNDPYFDHDWNRSHADTIRMRGHKYIVIDPKLSYLANNQTVNYEILPLTDSAFQSLANRKGIIDYIKISITTYREYAFINIWHDQRGPIWYQFIPCGSSTDYPLKKVGDRWKLLVQKPLGIVW